jgi:hypothetical protein
MIIPAAKADSHRSFFSRHPHRRFRHWFADGERQLVRHWPRAGEPNEFVRVVLHPSAPLPADTDRAICEAWAKIAYAGRPREAIAAAVERALSRSPR